LKMRADGAGVEGETGANPPEKNVNCSHQKVVAGDRKKKGEIARGLGAKVKKKRSSVSSIIRGKKRTKSLETINIIREKNSLIRLKKILTGVAKGSLNFSMR